MHLLLFPDWRKIQFNQNPMTLLDVMSTCKRYKIASCMQCWFVGKVEFCARLQPRFRIYFIFAFAAFLNTTDCGVEIRASGRPINERWYYTKQIDTTKCIILPLNPHKVYGNSVEWLNVYFSWDAPLHEWLTMCCWLNMIEICFFVTGSDAVQGACRSAYGMTCSSPFAIHDGGIANDWRWLYWQTTNGRTYWCISKFPCPKQSYDKRVELDHWDVIMSFTTVLQDSSNSFYYFPIYRKYHLFNDDLY